MGTTGTPTVAHCRRVGKLRAEYVVWTFASSGASCRSGPTRTGFPKGPVGGGVAMDHRRPSFHNDRRRAWLGNLPLRLSAEGPANMDAAKRVAADREPATTRMSAKGFGGRSLRQRLDVAPGINDWLSCDGFVDVLFERP